MVHSESSKGKRGKPRGRPFLKGNKRGKLENDVLASSGREISNRGEVIAPPSNEVVEPYKDNFLDLRGLPEETVNKFLENNGLKVIEEEGKKESKPVPPNQMIDSIEFVNGNNKLKIAFLKKHSRQYRIQVFLNEDTEIRPLTYTGSSTANAFWGFLKSSLKE
jgi:hypothetical protein